MHDVSQFGITLPLLDSGVGLTVVAAQIPGGKRQTRHADGSKVIAVIKHPGFFILLDKFAYPGVAERINRCATDKR
ncbi:hypothetical protein D9M71_414360 [compost metagenome]